MILFWVLFNIFVLLMLALDLGVFHRRSHSVRFKEAMGWTIAWIAMAASFAVITHFWHGHTKALEFTTGYLIELSLSVDNLFVFLLLFRYFRVPAEYQHKVLFWGIVGALVMRLAFILLGISLINRFHAIIYVFGALLVYSGIQLFRSTETEVHPEKNPVLKAVRRWMPVTRDYVDGKFFVRQPGLFATPLFLVLVVVETTDVMFAVDSIPAVLAITRDSFIVYTSNVFAILGLRSMYFALSGMMERFRYLHYGLALILIFIGLKMLVSNYFTLPTAVALGVIAGTLGVTAVVSLLHKPANGHGRRPA